MDTTMTTSPPIRVDVPVCAFRPYASREYQDTSPVPAPSSVYGMLLSLIGVQREDKARHRGVEMALAVAEPPGRSKVFRKLRRGSDLENIRPDYQDLLMDLTLWVWLRKGTDTADPPLSARIPAALAAPETITRSGGLSLGESSYLVDSVSVGSVLPDQLVFLVPDRAGFFSFPTWVDHLESKQTVLERFRLSDPMPPSDGLTSAWFRIGGLNQE